MEAIILAGGKAERLGDAADGKPKALVPVAGEATGRVPGRAPRGCGRRAGDRQLRGGPGQRVRVRARTARPGDCRRRGAGAARPRGGLRFAARLRGENGPCFALNGDELLDADLAAALVAARALGRRCDDHRRASRARPSASSTSRRPGHRLPRGGAARAVGELRRLRPGGGRRRSPAGARGSRDDDVPRARSRGAPRRVSSRGSLAHGQHAEGSACGERAARSAGSVAPRRQSLTRRGRRDRTARVSESSPNLLDLDRFAHAVERVEKPWGYELIFARTDRYSGKGPLHPKRASNSLCSSIASRTRSSTSTKAESSSRSATPEAPSTSRSSALEGVPSESGSRAPLARARGRRRPRGLHARARRRRASRRQVRPHRLTVRVDPRPSAHCGRWSKSARRRHRIRHEARATRHEIPNTIALGRRLGAPDYAREFIARATGRRDARHAAPRVRGGCFPYTVARHGDDRTQARRQGPRAGAARRHARRVGRPPDARAHRHPRAVR